MKAILLSGRILFSLIFLNTIMFHFRESAVAYAESHGVPAASFLVPFSGVIAMLGAFSIMFGYQAKMGAWLIALFLIPVTYYMHAFWKETDTMQYQIQMANFMKNISMLGGAFILTYFGAGPLSLDDRMKVKVQKLTVEKSNGSIKEEIKEKEKVTAPAEAQEFIREFCPFIRKSYHV